MENCHRISGFSLFQNGDFSVSYMFQLPIGVTIANWTKGEMFQLLGFYISLHTSLPIKSWVKQPLRFSNITHRKKGNPWKTKGTWENCGKTIQNYVWLHHQFPIPRCEPMVLKISVFLHLPPVPGRVL